MGIQDKDELISDVWSADISSPVFPWLVRDVIDPDDDTSQANRLI